MTPLDTAFDTRVPRRRPIRRVLGLVLTGTLLAACGSKSPASPTTTGTPSTGGTTGTTASVTVSIVGSSGSQAFSPNPTTVAAGQTLAFRNTTGNTHRIVADNGSWDAGTIAAGATSAIVTISAATSVPYHCTIHSSMVGGINSGS